MLTIDAKINTMYPPGTSGGVRAYASATIDSCLAIRGIRVMEGREGLFVSMPSRKTGDEYKEICFPVTKEFREQLHTKILDTYQQAIMQNQTTQMQTQGQPENQQPDMQMGGM